MFAAISLGLAGNAPAYTVAVAIWALVAESAEFSPAIILYCGILILGITSSYARLNASQVSGGAAFTWVSRFVHPSAGFFAGWCILVASALFLVSASLPAAKAVLGILGVPAVENKLVVSATACLLFVALSAIAGRGVSLVGRMQTLLTGLEIGFLLLVVLVLVTRYPEIVIGTRFL
ncbi:MAG: amino acid permease, partial [Nitrospiraceae bacterium]